MNQSINLIIIFFSIAPSPATYPIRLRTTPRRLLFCLLRHGSSRTFITTLNFGRSSTPTSSESSPAATLHVAAIKGQWASQSAVEPFKQSFDRRRRGRGKSVATRNGSRGFAVGDDCAQDSTGGCLNVCNSLYFHGFGKVAYRFTRYYKGLQIKQGYMYLRIFSLTVFDILQEQLSYSLQLNSILGVY